MWCWMGRAPRRGEGGTLGESFGGWGLMQERQGVGIPGALFGQVARLVQEAWPACSLPGLMFDVVAGVDGEDVGLVDVVLVVGVEGADAQFLLGGQVGDVDRLAGEGIGAGEEGDTAPGSVVAGEVGEGGDPGAAAGGTAGADEVVLEAAAYGAELGRRGRVGDDAVCRRGEGGAGMAGFGGTGRRIGGGTGGVAGAARITWGRGSRRVVDVWIAGGPACLGLSRGGRRLREGDRGEGQGQKQREYERQGDAAGALQGWFSFHGSFLPLLVCGCKRYTVDAVTRDADLKQEASAC